MSIALFLGVPLLGGYVVSRRTRGDVRTWYPAVRKPTWTPPAGVFGPVWTLLYLAMGYAAYRVFRTGGGWVPMATYCLQLGLNFAWSIVFFERRDLKAAKWVTLALMGAIVCTMAAFEPYDAAASRLMLPYLAWVVFAHALTTEVHRLNPWIRPVRVR